MTTTGKPQLIRTDTGEAITIAGPPVDGEVLVATVANGRLEVIGLDLITVVDANGGTRPLTDIVAERS